MVQFKICENLSTFQTKINTTSEESVVFIKQEKLIWTHGQYYYCSDKLASELNSGLMSSDDKIKLDEIDLSNLVTVDVLNNRLNGYSIQVVNTLPGSLDANTIYMIV